MRFYKLRHKPTGLFYKPVGNEYLKKNNFHKDGKVYQQKPSINRVDNQLWQDGKYARLEKSEWEIVTFEVCEVETTDCVL